jgi:hypothetical protein
MARTATRPVRQSLKSVVGLTGPRDDVVLRVGLGRGLRMRINFTHQAGLYLGLYEIELNSSFRRLSRRSHLSFDIGGAIGYDALVLAQITGGSVHSFEQNGDLVAEIDHNVSLNPGLRSKITTVERAVGDGSDGTLAMDAYCCQLGDRPDFLKIDVEGAEYDVLRGAYRLLTEHRPALVIEVHSRELERQCDRYLRDLRYTVRRKSPRRWLPDNRPGAGYNGWLIATG